MTRFTTRRRLRGGVVVGSECCCCCCCCSSTSAFSCIWQDECKLKWGILPCCGCWLGLSWAAILLLGWELFNLGMVFICCCCCCFCAACMSNWTTADGLWRSISMSFCKPSACRALLVEPTGCVLADAFWCCCGCCCCCCWGAPNAWGLKGRCSPLLLGRCCCCCCCCCWSWLSSSAKVVDCCIVEAFWSCSDSSCSWWSRPPTPRPLLACWSYDRLTAVGLEEFLLLEESMLDVLIIIDMLDVCVLCACVCWVCVLCCVVCYDLRRACSLPAPLLPVLFFASWLSEKCVFTSCFLRELSILYTRFQHVHNIWLHEQTFILISNEHPFYSYFFEPERSYCELWCGTLLDRVESV